jgi:hypothetical protein
MNFKKINILLLLQLAISCIGQKNESNEEVNISIIKCDSIYQNKKISIKLINFDDERDGYLSDKNSILEIQTETSSKTKIILRDSIFSRVQKIKFADFNNDNIKDILVQNISDVRSNWTFNLYLYNPKKNNFIKVDGFEEIKNPLFNSKYNIVESHVNSGTNWLGFYKIIKHKVHNYEIVIDDRGDEKSESEYKKAINKIIKMKI